MKRNGNMMRAYRKIKCHLRSQAGMTLTEMLAAVLILSMTATAIGGGVAVVKEAYKKTTQKAEAQQVLATTAELITDVLSQAQEVRTGGTSGPEFYNGKTGSGCALGQCLIRKPTGHRKKIRIKPGSARFLLPITDRKLECPFFQTVLWQNGFIRILM